MSDVSETKYAELFTRYREASMLADKYELIAKTHVSVNKSLRETNDDLRRILLEKDEENAKLRELALNMHACTTHEDCETCPYAEDVCDFDYDMRKLGVEVPK